jgi:hypothetical protein
MKKFAIILAAASLSTAALAQGAIVDLATIDTDKSGDVSYVEAQAVWPDLTEEAFKAADVDGSGTLSLEEVSTLPAPTATTTQ